MTIIKDFKEFDFNKNKKIYIDFDSYSKFVEEANWYEKTKFERSSITSTESGFYGTSSLQEAIELSKTGWKQGINNLKECKLDNLIDKAKKNFALMTPVHNVYGQYVDIGKYLLDDPNCMVFNQIQTIPKRLSIIFEFGFNCTANQDDYSKLGNRLLSIIDSLERNNIRIELIARCCIEGNNGSLCVGNIKLKSFGEFLDLNKLSFACCHRAAHRRLWFSIAEKQTDDVRKTFGFYNDGNYGRRHDLIYTAQEEKENLILFSNHILNDANFAASIKKLSERL